ncbi:probable pectinesterase 53 [Impatiens glandulifera]|uniref:probable pectinesterase 53 n=1 Tax=Impatiens glandulifera TaxID=253017 RepID=UPI001FB190E3|nr:probable pectinesterase 53 [Impatiens glandulifera]
MASSNDHPLLIFIFILIISFTLGSSFDHQNDFGKWVSWNLENYRSKSNMVSIMSSKSESSIVGGGGETAGLDPKLAWAEANRMRITVSQDGTGDFMTVMEAIASLPYYNKKRRVIIDIKPGVYREKIYIRKGLQFITLMGDSDNPPTITGNDTASTVAGRDGNPMRTFLSATVAVDADYFIAVNLKFENTAPHVIGSKGGQAVAMRISGTKAAFYNCSFYGSQDTLYDHRGLHYFSNCFIQGSVDFIFGYGRSFYDRCTLYSVSPKAASLTAQKRSTASLTSGFSFKDCTVTGSGAGKVYLGRAWGDFSRVVYSFTYLDRIVTPQGWSDWGKRSRDSRVYYGEYQCSGPGSNMTGRVTWAHILTDEEAQPFLDTYFISGDSWIVSP